MKAFSSEITIGTSAPPTGSTKRTPKISERAASIRRGVVPISTTTQTQTPRTAARVAAITNLPPAKTTGRVVINSCNFIKVMMEPLNETQPTTTVNTVKITTAVLAPVPRFRYSTIATSAAAPPPTPLNSATSCGIWVISTLRAAGTPIMRPIAIAPTIHQKLWSGRACPTSSPRAGVTYRNTESVARVAPKAPIKFPRRAVFGCESPLRAKINATPAANPTRL